GSRLSIDKKIRAALSGDPMFFAGEGARAAFEMLRSVVFAAGAFPGHQLANRRSAGAGGWVFVCLHFGTRRFLSHRANAEADLLLILFILMILKSCSWPG